MEWDAPWRTARIYQVLESGRQFSSADMFALQTDIHSEPYLFAAKQFVYAVDHASNPVSDDETGCGSVAELGWPMQASSAAPTITENSLRELRRLLLEPNWEAVRQKGR